MTIYLTVFVHWYLMVIASAAFQVLAVVWYLASFIPGGTRGLQLLLKTAYVIVGTVLKPFVFVCKKTVSSVLGQMFS